MIVWGHILAAALLRFIPVRVAHRVVAWGVPPVLFFARGYVERAAANMRQVLGPHAPADEVRRLTRAAFVNYGRYLVDILRLATADPHRLGRGWEIHGWQHLEHAFSLNRGVILVTGHIGSWDLAGAVLAARGLPVSVVVETLKPARWNERVQQIRERVGLRAIPVESGVRDMLAALRRKEGLAVLVDRPVAENGVRVHFFGRETRVPGGAATLALRTGAAIIPAVMVRGPHGRGYIAKIGEPILGIRSGSTERDIQHITQQVISWLEGIIRLYPDQWFMFRHMWPAGETATGVWRVCRPE